jgi:hypothetical protein
MAGALIGALRVSLSAETSAFEAGMKRSQRQAATTASSIERSFKGVGGALKAGIAGFVSSLSVGLVLAAGRAALDYAGQLGEVSQQLGVTTRDLQVLRYAAGQVGVSQEELEKGLSKLTITLGQVAAGAAAPAKALAAIGITVDDLKGKDTGEAFRIIADGLSKIEDRSQRAAVEVALFGRSGAKLDTLLAGGSAALNELALAAEELGIVLSDKQIQDADKTADKLDALKTVLSARIAGVVSDNADSILSLADALANLISWIGKATKSWTDFLNAFDAQSWQVAANNPFLSGDKRQSAAAAAARARGRISDSGVGWGVAGSSVTTKLSEGGRAREIAKQMGLKLPSTAGGGEISPFLARGGGGGGRGGRGDADRAAREAERKRLDALRDLNRFDQEIRRAKIDVLRAEEQLSVDYIERAAIAKLIIDAERAAYESQLAYEIAAGDMQAAQAEQLLLENARVVSLEKQRIDQDMEAQRAQESARLDEVTLDIQRDALEAQLQLAETAAEQRDLQLRLLDLSYRQERARLEAVLADEQSSFAAKEEARRRLAGLDATQATDTQGVINRTRGPMEEWSAQFGDITEEMENLKVQGIMGAVDALTALTGGFDDFRDAALNAIKSVIAEMIRLQLMKAAVSLFGSATGVPGAGEFFAGGAPLSFAGGGGFDIRGRGGIDRNVLSLNGLPIANVSYGERINVENDSHSSRSAMTVHAPITIQGNATRETVAQMESAVRRAVGNSSRRGY